MGFGDMCLHVMVSRIWQGIDKGVVEIYACTGFGQRVCGLKQQQTHRRLHDLVRDLEGLGTGKGF